MSSVNLILDYAPPNIYITQYSLAQKHELIVESAVNEIAYLISDESHQIFSQCTPWLVIAIGIDILSLPIATTQSPKPEPEILMPDKAGFFCNCVIMVANSAVFTPSSFIHCCCLVI